MAVERLIGVQVSSEHGYEEYRRQISPLLAAAGGRFTVDVRVSEVLTAPDDARFNRLFVLRFPNDEAMRNFFESEAYRAVRDAHFVSSVSSTTSLATYQLSE